MGTEVINISVDKESEPTVISTGHSTSNQVNAIHPKSPSVDDSSGARKDLWGPRLFGKTTESKGLKKSKEPKGSEESDIKEHGVISPIEALPIHHDATFSKGEEVHCMRDLKKDSDIPNNGLNPEDQKPTKYEESDSPIKSESTSSNVGNVRSEHAASQPTPDSTEKCISGESQPSGDHPIKSESTSSNVGNVRLGHAASQPTPDSTEKCISGESQPYADHPIKSESTSPNVGNVRTGHAASQSIPDSTEKCISGESQPSADHAANENKPTKISLVHTTSQPLQCDKAMYTDEEDDHSLVSSTTSSMRSPPKFRTTVAIGPVFRCSERADKRKEFYAKLEQKQQALEAEKMEAVARSKEELEASLKQLRRNMNFKAKPMPSFYQEGPPAKTEIKKTPPTRAKSPKLGRRKSFNDATNGDNNSGTCHRLSRHSVDTNKEVPSRLSLDNSKCIAKRSQHGTKIRNAASRDKERSDTSLEVEAAK